MNKYKIKIDLFDRKKKAFHREIPIHGGLLWDCLRRVSCV